MMKDLSQARQFPMTHRPPSRRDGRIKPRAGFGAFAARFFLRKVSPHLLWEKEEETKAGRPGMESTSFVRARLQPCRKRPGIHAALAAEGCICLLPRSLSIAGTVFETQIFLGAQREQP
jgi:hypothetical protein